MTVSLANSRLSLNSTGVNADRAKRVAATIAENMQKGLYGAIQ